ALDERNDRVARDLELAVAHANAFAARGKLHCCHRLTLPDPSSRCTDRGPTLPQSHPKVRSMTPTPDHRTPTTDHGTSRQRTTDRGQRAFAFEMNQAVRLWSLSVIRSLWSVVRCL